jgi:hypothetical protein
MRADELRAIALEHASLSYMQKHKDRFDDAMMRAGSEKELLPPGSDSSKVRVGQVRGFEWGNEIVSLYDALWRQHVAPVTGFDSYSALIPSMQ